MERKQNRKSCNGFAGIIIALTLTGLLVPGPLHARQYGTHLPKNPRKFFTMAAAIESPFMSIYFPLPSFAFSGFFNIHDFNIGFKIGSPTPWLLGHVANADQSKIWYVPLYYIEPIEIRYTFFDRILLGCSFGYRHIEGSKGEASPVLEKTDSRADMDGSYKFTIKEWYAKTYLGFGLNGNPSNKGIITVEVGAIWALDRGEEYSYSVRDTGNRADSLRNTNFAGYLSENLPAFRDSVHQNVFPFQYIYLSLRYNFSGI